LIARPRDAAQVLPAPRGTDAGGLQEDDTLARHDRLLDRERSLLLAIDLQESYRGKLFREEAVVAAARRTIEAAGLLGIPVIVTEQYPKGLGGTRSEIAEKIPDGSPRFEKTRFSALGAPGLATELERLGRSQVVVIGIETHVCVGQTVHDLLALRYAVHVLRDAVTARFAVEDEVGWAKLIGSGAVPSTSECALFEWLGDARAPEFKAVHRLVV
jgi:nicotinamidase-related amidase